MREITLTEIAHLIDRRSRRAEADRAPVSATDRVMVGLSSRSPSAPALLRKAASTSYPHEAAACYAKAEQLRRTHGV